MSERESSPLFPAALAAVVSVVSAGLLLRGDRPLFEALAVGGFAGLGAALLAARRPPDAPAEASLADLAADLTPDALLLYEEDGRIAYANATARNLFFEGADPSGENFLRLVGRAPNALSSALLGQSARLITLVVDDRHETFSVSRQAHHVGDRELTLLVVQNLTREVSQREVETLKNVVRVLSHEVNNSLAPIASLVHSARKLAGRPELSAKLDAAFDTIGERARHLQGFIEGYARLARLPAPHAQAVNLEKFLDHLRSLYPEARIPAAAGVSGWFDPTQIEQVLINLFKNAVEAGSAPSDVELVIDDASDGVTRMEVRDRGSGFSEEALASAFTPFFTTKSGGSGMGHALCREIVHAHGGSIGIANRKDGGGRVTLELPGKAAVDPRLAASRTKLTLSRF